MFVIIIINNLLWQEYHKIFYSIPSKVSSMQSVKNKTKYKCGGTVASWVNVDS